MSVIYEKRVHNLEQRVAELERALAKFAPKEKAPPVSAGEPSLEDMKCWGAADGLRDT